MEEVKEGKEKVESTFCKIESKDDDYEKVEINNLETDEEKLIEEKKEMESASCEIESKDKDCEKSKFYDSFKKGAEKESELWLINFGHINTNCKPIAFPSDTTFKDLREYINAYGPDKVEYLDLSDCKHITDISILSLCHNLKKLKIDRTGICDFKPLLDCTNLEELYASDIHTPLDLSSLTSCQDLKILNVSNSNIYSNEGSVCDSHYSYFYRFRNFPSVNNKNFHRFHTIRLPNCHKLEKVDLSFTKIKNLYLRYDSIKDLRINNTNLSCLSIPPKNDALETLYCNNTKLSGDASLIFNDTPFLKILNLSNNDISGVPQLEAPLLEYVYLNDTKITDISFLEKCGEITHLELQKTLVSDISILAECKKLNYLDISNTSVCNVNSLADCKLIEYLDISNTKITDISALKGLINLETLVLHRYLKSEFLIDYKTINKLQLWDIQINDIITMIQCQNDGHYSYDTGKKIYKLLIESQPEEEKNIEKEDDIPSLKEKIRQLEQTIKDIETRVTNKLPPNPICS
jgi:Leucine-rich repeat (LRR) protein